MLLLISIIICNRSVQFFQMSVMFCFINIVCFLVKFVMEAEISWFGLMCYAMVPFIFYFYYRKNMPLEIVSFLFVFLTMKRLAFITGIVIIVLSILTKGKRTSVYKLNRVFVIIPCVAFVLLPLITNVFLNDAFASWFFEKTGLNISLK